MQFTDDVTTVDKDAYVPTLTMQEAMSRHVGKINWVSYAIIAVSLLVLIRALPLSEGVMALRSWVERLGVWGPVIFGLIYVVAVVAMVPASLLTLAAGATFGLLVGTVTVVIAANVGAALALLIARYLARNKVERFAEQRPRFAAIDQAINEGGWKIVAMLRLSPAIPFNVQNYLYGLTSIGFWTCVLTSLFAMLPGTFLYVYLGHAAGSVTGAGGEKSPAQWALLGVGLLATIGVTVYVTRLAQRKLREQTRIDGENDDSDTEATATSTEDTAPPSESSLFKMLLPAGLAVVLGGVAVASLVNPTATSKLVRRLLPLGPPQVEMSEQYGESDGGASFDHSAFDSVVSTFVNEDGWVDYDGLSKDTSRLDDYLKSLAAAPFDELGRDDKLALLINAYNAFTLRLILDHWPLESIKDIPAAERWEARRWNVGGNTWSLEQIEHEQIRPNFKEPRIHFALVCAAVGCPPLANEAFTAEHLESQLQRQAEYVHTHSTWLQADPQAHTVALTPLYQWYAGDFLQAADSVVSYAARFSPTLQQMVNESPLPRVTYLPYDWSINSQANSRPR